MQYIYGISQRFGTLCENLKTVGAEHTDFSGYIQTVTELGDGTKITDRCRIIEKYASKEANGLCYDWYLIDNHYRTEDTTAKAQKSIEAVMATVDYLSMMSGIDIPGESAMMTLESNGHSKNFKKVSDYAKESLWNAGMIANAVGKWITEEEYDEIVGST